MFIFEFKDNSCLIQRIVISGRYLTIYFSKKDSQELHSTIKKFNLTSIVSGDHPFHVFCHTPFVDFSAQGAAVSHKHLEFPADADRLELIKTLFNYLLKLNTLEHRQREYDALYSAFDKERQSLGDEKFPGEVQNILDNYDLVTRFFPAEEYDDLIKQFKNYLNNYFFVLIEGVSYHAEMLIEKNWDVLYTKRILDFDSTPMTKNESNLCDYYQSILDLRFILLAIADQSENLPFYYNARMKIEGIKDNPYHSDVNTGYKAVDKLDTYLLGKINSLENRLILNLSSIAGSVSLLGLRLFSEEALATVLLKSLLTTTTIAASGLAVKYFGKPLVRWASTHFFSHKKIVVDGNTEKQTNNPIIFKNN